MVLIFLENISNRQPIFTLTLHNLYIDFQWVSEHTMPQYRTMATEKQQKQEVTLTSSSSPLKQALKPRKDFSDLPLYHVIRPSWDR